jgi:D-alanine-D-alanine ligase-like ATP-grasp enzyme
VKILLLKPAATLDPAGASKITAIHSTLVRLGFEVVQQNFDSTLFSSLVQEKPDIVFNLASIFEWNKTNYIPAILEIASVQYTGSGFFTLSLVRNPTKLWPLLQKSNVPVVPYQIIKAGNSIPADGLRFPLDLCRDNSNQDSIIPDEMSLRQALDQLPQQEELVLREHMNGKISGLFILDSLPFFSHPNPVFLAPALSAYHLIEARGLVRFDFTASVQPLLLNIEVSPDPLDENFLTEAAAAGWNQEKLLQLIVEHAGHD